MLKLISPKKVSFMKYLSKVFLLGCLVFSLFLPKLAFAEESAYLPGTSLEPGQGNEIQKVVVGAPVGDKNLSETAVAEETLPSSLGGADNGYLIQGYVTDSNWKGIPAVTINFSNNTSTQTQSNGYYEKGDFANGYYTITPEKAGYIFEPNFRKVHIKGGPAYNNHFIAHPINTCSISGYVKDLAGNPVKGVTIIFSDIWEVKTDSIGYYQKLGFTPCTYIVTPRKYGYRFEPQSQEVTIINTNVNNLDFYALPLETYSISGYVKDLIGNPLPEVEIHFSNGSSVTTDNNGYFEKPGFFNYGTYIYGTYIVMPWHDDYVFEPSSELVIIHNGNVSNLKFTAKSPKIVWVDKGGGGNFTTIQEAVNTVSEWSEIRVVQGTYTPAAGSRAVVDWEYKPLKLKGGYAKVYGERNPKLYPTIIDGQNQKAGVINNYVTGLEFSGFEVRRCQWLYQGAGMMNILNYGLLLIKDCIFKENTSYTYGGAVFTGRNDREIDGITIITNCDFISNKATAGGGGHYSEHGWHHGGGLLNYMGAFKVSYCHFINNYADGVGGGMLNWFVSNGLVSHCEFINNKAEGSGGGLTLFWGARDLSPSTVEDSFFKGNWVNPYTSRGGAMEIFGAGDPGSIWLAATTGPRENLVTVRNCTLVDNYAPGKRGNGIFIDLDADVILHSLISRNGGDGGDDEIFIYDLGFSDILVKYSNIQGGYPGEGNIDLDPEFVNPANEDYHLLSTSPCIDTGDPTFLPEEGAVDMDGDPRLLDGNTNSVAIVDMGIDEFSINCNYSTSGRVQDSLGNAIKGAKIELTPFGGPVYTNSNGNYEVRGLSNSIYTVTPSKEGYNFEPPSQQITINNASVSNVDFTAIPATASISGYVRDASGNSMSNVIVTFTPYGSTVQTNFQGYYEKGGFANGTYTVTPSKTGYTFSPTSQQVTINNANVFNVNFTATLLPTYSISGKVSLNSGAGLEGVTITFSPTGGTTVQTLSDGTYIKDGFVNGTYTVTPSKTGYTFSPSSQQVTINNANVFNVNFTATSPAPYSISGYISTGYGPVINVTVSFLPTGGSVLTNFLGYYIRDGLGNGTYTVTPSKPGHVFSPTSQQVTINNANVSNINFTVTAQLYSISGYVKTSAGQGVVDVMIWISPPGTAVLTQSSGYYESGLLTNGTYTVTPSKTGYTFSPVSQQVTINYANVENINFTVIPTYSISGKVSLNSGTGLEGVTISFSPTGGSVQTLSDGTYIKAGFSNGTYTVTPSKTGYTFSPTSQQVTINNANVSNVNFTATSTATYSISGKVSLNSGAGLGGVTISFSPTGGSVQTLSDGTYIKAGFSNGTYTVTPSKTGYTFSPVSQQVTINYANVENINFTAIPTYSISGKVSLNSGAGLGGVTISFSPTGGSVQTLSDGTYIKAGFSNGTYTVTPFKTGYTFSPTSQQVTINNASVPNVNFIALLTYSISGYIKTASGVGVEAVTINFSPTGGSVQTNSSGYYIKGGFVNGNYTVTPSHPDYAFIPASSEVTINNANLSKIDFTALKNYSISGYVRDSAGAGVGGVKVTFTPGGYSVSTQNNGFYVKDALSNGNYTVTPYKYGGYGFNPPSQNVTINNAHVGNVDFTIFSTYIISGYVSKGGLGFPEVTINFSPTGGSTQTGSSGWFSKDGFANGTYTVTPSKDGYGFDPPSRQAIVNNNHATGVNFIGLTNYSISGYVRDSTGAGVYAVKVTFTPGGYTWTDEKGYYAKDGLSNNTYTVTPSKTGYTFSPPSQNVNINNAHVFNVDFTAISTATYSISGYVKTSAGSGVGEVTISFTPTGGSVQTYSNGYYQQTGFSNGNYTVTPSKFGFDFNPVTQPVTISGTNVTGIDFEAIAWLKGDINEDGKVNTADIAPFVAVLMKQDTNPRHIWAADCNNDGKADTFDIAPFMALLSP